MKKSQRQQQIIFLSLFFWLVALVISGMVLFQVKANGDEPIYRPSFDIPVEFIYMWLVAFIAFLIVAYLATKQYAG
jgi:cytochrome b subunit of formate dehydrogenase